MLDKLLERINELGGIQYFEKKNKDGIIINRHTRIPQVIVTLEDFFEGMPESCTHNYACNINFASNAGFSDFEFYELFKTVREKEMVQDVWVELSDYDPEEYEYPYSETCYISTAANEDELMKWFGDVAFPSEIHICEDGEIEGIPTIKVGYTLFCCWWD